MCVVFLWFVPLSAQMSHPLPGTSTSWELTETSRRKGYEQELHRSDEWMVEVPAPHCYFCSIFPNSCLFCIVSGGRYMLCVPAYVQVPAEARRGTQIPCSWSYRQLWAAHGTAVWCWKQKSEPWEECEVLLPTEPSPVPASLSSIPSCHHFLFHPRVKRLRFVAEGIACIGPPSFLFLVVVVLFGLVFRFPLCMVLPLTSEFTAIVRLPPSWTTLNSCVSHIITAHIPRTDGCQYLLVFVTLCGHYEPLKLGSSTA